ncbi:hypothetical protein CEXT_86241 [Caerostris extrusa]|uniref:Uncharacterized protein n=1 Tax=Caerostris extrusa TaxID=172846 RepID=A0AAV4XEQ0_CAEEX|nr:hypothetical protein CEXT_86241 [Caerostris extrusa]
MFFLEQFSERSLQLWSRRRKMRHYGNFSPTYTFPTGKHYNDRRMYLKVGPERPFCVHQYQVILHVHSFSGYLLTYGFESGLCRNNDFGTYRKTESQITH